MPPQTFNAPENSCRRELFINQALKKGRDPKKKQDSYLQAIGNVEDDMLTPLPLRSTGVRKQESYQRAVLAGGVGSFTTGN